MSAYYNENDPFAAAWLRELIRQNEIAPGFVDERDIQEVQPNDLTGYTQHHFFAGIGGWSYALRLAGWPDDEPVWTGSCPCQPFSVAGKGAGAADKRHLWPEMFRLVRARRPLVCFGEQVANAVGGGWLDGVSTDLESEGYQVGAAVLGAHSVGAPHIRQRLFWVGHTLRPAGPRLGPISVPLEPEQETIRSGIADAWSEYHLVKCADKRTRVSEPGVCPVAHGVPFRLGRLRGYGNAIVPQTGAAFVRAFIDWKGAVDAR